MSRGLLIIATGAANILRLPDILSQLRNASAGTQFNLLITEGAERLIQHQMLSVFADKVYLESDPEVHFRPGHIGLALDHEAVIVLPSTAQTLAAAAHGLCTRLAGEVILAHGNPVVFFPTMNRHMWESTPTRRNVEQLRADGHIVIEPTQVVSYETATGQTRVNPGLLPSSEIVSIILQQLESALERS